MRRARYYALLLVPAGWLWLRQRAWRWGPVAVLIGLALWMTRSRAALAAAVIGVGCAWLASRRISGRALVAAAGLAAVAVAGVVLMPVGRQAQPETALRIRVALNEVGLRVAATRPVFGVGFNQFQRQSLPFVTPDLAHQFPPAVRGENAHNNFVQVLAELGVVGLLAFGWMLLVPVARVVHSRTDDARDPAFMGLAGGLAAFLLTCLLGHPLLTTQVLFPFFLQLGLIAGLAPAVTLPPGGVPRRAAVVTAGLVAVVIASVPFRTMQQRRAADLDHVAIGASMSQDALDGRTYRVAEPRSSWFVPSNAQVVEIPLRLSAASRPPCRVNVLVDGRTVNVVEPPAYAWLPVRLAMPASDRAAAVSRRVDLQVQSAECTLFVGRIETR